MTAAQLFSYITVALLLQLVAGAAFVVWRRSSTAGVPTPVGVEEVVATAGFASGAWSGWRDFRVVRREFEDAAQTQCSFHLRPVDGAPLKPFQPGQYLTFSLKVPGGDAGAPVEVLFAVTPAGSDRLPHHRQTRAATPGPAGIAAGRVVRVLS